MAEGVTQRGFTIYRTLTDNYGQEICVIQSSRADEPAVWIQCDGKPGWPHLNREQAALVCAALAEFIAGLPAPSLDADPA